MIGVRRAISLFTRARKAPGPRRFGSGTSAPSSSSRSRAMSSLRPLFKMSAKRSTIGCGVPLGANMA